jgi:hypothetical protein
VATDVRYKAPQGLVIEPQCIKFKAIEEFERCLDEARATRPILIRRPEDILLSLNGLVQERYQFTPWGLWSLCRRLSPNLGSVVSDLACLGNKMAKKAKVRPDPRAAVSVLNTVIRSRFDLALNGARLIIDPVWRSIDGVVGSRYEFVSNADIFDACQEFVLSRGGEFLSASLFGRRMYLRYANPNPWFEAGPNTYRIGWGFSNSETGQSTIRGGILIVDEDNCSSMRVVVKRKHTKNLRESGEQWLAGEMEQATEAINVELLARNMERLFNQTIPGSLRPQEASRMAEQLILNLGRQVPRAAAREAARDLYTPSEAQAKPELWKIPNSPIPQAVAGRPYYAFYESLTRMAGNYLPQDQEAIESLAYEFLRGRFDPCKEAKPRRAKQKSK